MTWALTGENVPVRPAPPSLPRIARRVAGLAFGLTLVGVTTLLLLPVREDVTVATPALALIVPGIVVGFVGSRVAAVVTASTAAITLDVVFIEPYGTLDVHLTDDLVALVVFAAVAVSVATLVERATERRRAAEQRAQEILALSEEKERYRRQQERLSLEKQALEQIEDARRALLRSVSHDLRTPLATIRAITTDLRAGTDYDDATRDELLDLVADEAERLDRLVANLLSMSRIEAGALHPELQAVALDDLVGERVRRLARVLREVHLETDVAADLPLVEADYTLVDQVVTNLLDNAVRHTPPGRTVRVAARAAGDVVELTVDDEGDGVPPAQRELVFEPFHRGADSRSSGLGLAICKAIVEAHRGHIAVEDAPSGTGARFVLSLPVHRARLEAPAP